MTTGTRLAIAGAIVLCVTAYMAYVGAASSWQYYVTVDECLSAGDAMRHKYLRVSGVIQEGSLRIAPDREGATFALVGNGGVLPANYIGLLPDNLAEARPVVVEGRMEDTGVLRAHKLLTRCASKYTSEASNANDSQPGNGERQAK